MGAKRVVSDGDQNHRGWSEAWVGGIVSAFDRSTDRCGFSKQHCGLQPGFRDWSQNSIKTLPGPEGSVEKPGNELDGILVDQNQELISALKNMGFQEREIRMVLPQAGEKDQPLEERLKKVLSLLTPLR